MLHCLGDQCTVATRDRELCMYEGVPQTVCENKGCCYDTMTSPNCYYSNNEGMHEFQGITLEIWTQKNIAVTDPREGNVFRTVCLSTGGSLPPKRFAHQLTELTSSGSPCSGCKVNRTGMHSCFLLPHFCNALFTLTQRMGVCINIDAMSNFGSDANIKCEHTLKHSFVMWDCWCINLRKYLLILFCFTG